MKVVAIVVNWNGGAQNLRCLESLLASAPAVERVLFVDNASSDGSRELVARELPQVEILDSGANLGYGGGNNLGIARALALGADAVLVVNNDLTFAPGAIALLVEALEREHGAALIGPRVLLRDEPHKIWAAGGQLSWRQNLTTLRGFCQLDRPEFAEQVEVDYVPGCALLIRREALEKVRGFDERYFAYTEDVDLGVRAKRAGFRSLCVGAARAFHAPSSSTGGGYNPRRKYMMAVNSVWFLREYAGAREWLRFIAFDVLTLPLLWADAYFRGHGKAVAAKALGILHGLRGKRITSDTVRSGATSLW